MIDNLENKVMRTRGKFGLRVMLAAALFSAVGCVSNYINTSVGAIFPGRAKEKGLPTLTVGELGYTARFNNSKWGVGLLYQYGTGYMSDNGNPTANEPAYNSSLNTSVGTLYAQYSFGNNSKKLHLRAGFKTGVQDLTTSVKEPINETFNESDTVNGGSISACLEFWNKKEEIAVYLQAEETFYDSKNITDTATLSAGLSIILD
ncbi:hypothetical protein KY342_00840 [Candidatus Woesearchaeota archaeon]|nr:hypothetical protein [Candidatus Woesearchaeota archaeon]